MGFSEKAKKYFYEDLKLNNRQISKIMDDYNEVLISRYLNSDSISSTFLKKIKKYFPDADINYLISESSQNLNIVNDQKEVYQKSLKKRVDAIIKELKEKDILE